MSQTQSIDKDDVMYVPELHKAGLISENVFSFFLTGSAESSYIDFGKPNESAMSDEDDLVWIESKNIGGYWTNYVNGFRWSGANMDETSYSLDKKWALTDTGSSCILGPPNAIDYIIETVEDIVSDTGYDD